MTAATASSLNVVWRRFPLRASKTFNEAMSSLDAQLRYPYFKWQTAARSHGNRCAKGRICPAYKNLGHYVASKRPRNLPDCHDRRRDGNMSWHRVLGLSALRI